MDAITLLLDALAPLELLGINCPQSREVIPAGPIPYIEDGWLQATPLNHRVKGRKY